MKGAGTFEPSLLGWQDVDMQQSGEGTFQMKKEQE